MKKYLLVDVDGTLIDSYPGIRESFITALRTHGYGIPDESFLRGLPGPPMRESMIAAGVSALKLSDVMATYSEHQRTIGWKMSAPFEGMKELLARWRDEGYVLATATSKSYSGAVQALTHYGMIDYFHYLATAEDGGGPRQHKADVIDYAFELMAGGVPKNRDEYLLIGDRKHDATGAEQHGIDSVLVTWGYGSENELALATAVADSPAELASLVATM